MSYNARIVLDSINDYGQRLTTMEWTYPRFIHAEIMTHRDRARNAASSRAIPWAKMKEAVSSNPVVPIAWGIEKPGMQTGEPLPPHLADLAESLWVKASKIMLEYADAIHNIGATYDALERNGCILGENDFNNIPLNMTSDPSIKVHKSLPNRLVEPWMWITVIMTATEWENLWRLRVHPDAEIHFQKIAGLAKDALESSIPKALPFGDWHLPYITDEEKEQFGWSHPILRKASTARCARVSYKTHDGEANIGKDCALFDKLCAGSGFGHWSPHEHVAMSSTPDTRSGPFRGYIQYRKLFAKECG